MFTKTIHKQGKTHGSNYAHILQRFRIKIGTKKDQNDSNLVPKGAPGATRAPKMVHEGPQEAPKGP